MSAPSRPAELRDQLRAQARSLGFVEAGIASVRPFRVARRRALRAIDEGRMDGMPWFGPERIEHAADLHGRHPWARSLLALAWPYAPAPSAGETSTAAPGRPRGRMSAYACLPDGADYHDLLARRCDELVGWLGERVPGLRSHRFIDHGWAMDRPVAERAGLGFAGKNACLITRGAGSYVLLAEVLLSVALPPTP
ncbi:MAG: DUF1730 domain-containing protein, partial [Chloroflexi bacterium]